VVVDFGSTDGTPDIIRNVYSGKGIHVAVQIVESIRGRTEARQRAIKWLMHEGPVCLNVVSS
jgi:glycosyltransferase involved in cell wall biosynthesis